MAKKNYQYEKRQKEIAKKKKQEEKRQRKLNKTSATGKEKSEISSEDTGNEAETTDDDI
ncbi:MAG: hypothetical protein ISS80_07055 [Candidatus Cloacimonetes bacterium]|nr:hypothetical protein [Candidatus Cloacimonadota bacterium]